MSNARDIADAGHMLVAWVNFDGTSVSGTGDTASINASFNVDSIDDVAAGKQKVNISAGVLSDTNACVLIEASLGTPHGDQVDFKEAFLQNDSGVYKVYTGTYNGSFQDANSVSVTVFR